MEQIIEIRSYQLQAGTAERFSQLMQQQSLPLLLAAGTEVVATRPSLHAPDCYLLIRAYRSLEQRELSQDAFYTSPAWLDGPRAEIMACIAHYTTVVIPADPALLASLRCGAELPGHQISSKQ
ncbi:MAG: NIPSNAP family protein [Burkholderiales bacterium]|nr:NIPSNAP family protein [Burkholderiales bacterium]